jgi:hypothetical protein
MSISMRHWLPLLVTLLAPVLAGCGGELAASDALRDRALAIYAPGIRLGALAPTVTDRYEFTVAPYVGYVDTTYHAPDNFTDLYLWLTRPPGDGVNPTVVPWARIESASLHTTDSSGAQSAEARLRAMLGPPDVTCYRGAQAELLRSLYWPSETGRGVLLVIPATWERESPRLDTLREARLVFGATPLTSVSSATPQFTSCSLVDSAGTPPV